MKQSLAGLLKNSAEYVEEFEKLTDSQTGGISFALRELLENLTELRERKAEGQKVLDEFFAIYV